MPHKFTLGAAGFAEAFASFLRLREAGGKDVSSAVAAIIAEVRKRGDAALRELTLKFDRFEPAAFSFSIEEIKEAGHACSPEVKRALALAAARIRAYHEKQLPQDADYIDEEGVRLGWRWNAIDAVGIYVPGGTASYPSSVLMNAVPAKVAGVKRLAMVVPTPGGEINPALLVAAQLAGVDEIYRVGGAQAVAALAFGTQSILAVDKIVGPGNAYVAEAKRQVFGHVGIDMIAGPSEIVVVADGRNEPAWIAADLMSQAEHDAMSQAVLITDDVNFAAAVEKEVEQLLTRLPRAAIAGESWKQYGGIFIVPTLADAPALVDAMAPEHVELAVEEPDALAKEIHHAGAIFLGKHAPEALGDYVAGPSHVLPTSRTARFSSGLGVLEFMKRSSLVGCSEQAFAAIAGAGETLATAEGLEAHRLSLAARRS